MRLCYPKLLDGVPRRVKFNVDLDGVLWESYVELTMMYSISVNTPTQLRFTEKPGGTDAWFPVSRFNVEIGMITLACGAGGCFSEEAKNVACSCALIPVKWLPEVCPSHRNLLAYSPSRPGFIKLSSCKINVPGFEKSGV